MRSKVFYIFIIFTLFLLAGCGPSEQAIQEALAQTQTAQVTNTNTPEPTLTFTLEPTFTQTFTQTLTPTFTQTLTPTPDNRVFTLGPEVFLLTVEDLPKEARYYLPYSTWISPHRNSEVVSDWGREAGTAYIEETGRLDGWFAIYKLGSTTVRAPDEIFHNIIQFETNEGALLALDIESPNVTVEYEIIDDNYGLGDLTIISKYREMQPSGEYQISYYVETVYRNYESRVGGSGFEKDFDLDYVIQIAEIALDKLKEAPLGNW